MLQLMPALAGSGSVRVTLVAVPVPRAPLLPAVMVKPSEESAVTVAESAVMATLSTGGPALTDHVPTMNPGLEIDVVKSKTELDKTRDPANAVLKLKLRLTVSIVPEPEIDEAAPFSVHSLFCTVAAPGRVKVPEKPLSE
jgi:hypothetical protein